jgi:hypothetical protein
MNAGDKKRPEDKVFYMICGEFVPKFIFESCDIEKWEATSCGSDEEARRQRGSIVY